MSTVWIELEGSSLWVTGSAAAESGYGQSGGVQPPDKTPEAPLEPLILRAPRRLTGALAVGAALLTVLAVLADPAGRLLAGSGAVLATLAVARDLLLGPVLRADHSGVTVLAGWRQVHAPWSTVAALTVRTDRRTPVLDLDLGDTVVVLSRLRLGAAPGDILLVLRALQGGTHNPTS